DLMAGGNGDDVYRYNLGDGHDTILDDNPTFLAGEFDVVELGAGILPADVHVVRDAAHMSDLILEMTDGGSIRLQGQVGYTSLPNWRPTEVEEVHFADGTVWTAHDLRQHFLEQAATAGDDDIVGFFADDTLTGGAGNDHLSGGDGSDTYLFGFGD